MQKKIILYKIQIFYIVCKINKRSCIDQWNLIFTMFGHCAQFNYTLHEESKGQLLLCFNLLVDWFLYLFYQIDQIGLSLQYV